MTQRSLVQIQPLQPERRGKVIGTTRDRERSGKLEDLGAHRAELEGPDLSKRIAEAKHIDAVLDLVGNSTILDSLRMLRRGGRACFAGWLGGLAPIADFNPAPANGKRRRSDLLRQLRAAVFSLGRSASDHRRKGGGRPI